MTLGLFGNDRVVVAQLPDRPGPIQLRIEWSEVVQREGSTTTPGSRDCSRHLVVSAADEDGAGGPPAGGDPPGEAGGLD